MKRRQFVSSLVATVLPSDIPIIDTHIHLFDVSRPQGVPWPEKGSKIHQTALPSRLQKLAQPHGVVGAIELECSPWLEDNQWVLDTIAHEPFIVGTIGDLEPGKPGFAKNLERFHKNPLFRGIRYGNIWDRSLAAQVQNQAFLSDLKILADAGLVLDTANPDATLMHAVVRLSDTLPGLRIILDHLPSLPLPANPAACEADLKLLAQRPQIFAKISALVNPVKDRLPLSQIWELFGADRLMYGSDWPNSDQWSTYGEVFQLARDFIASKDHATLNKFYWQNSLKVYGWIKRDSKQPPL